MIRKGCYILSALMLIGACAYTIYGPHRGLGIFFILIAVVLSRVLIINIAGSIEEAGVKKQEIDRNGDQSER